MVDELNLRTLDGIERTLRQTLTQMQYVYELEESVPGVKRVAGRGFSDAYEEQGLINTAEALCCITIPYFTISSFCQPFWREELVKHEIIREAVQFFLDPPYRNNDPTSRGTFGFEGTPYIDFRRRGKPGKYGADSGISHNLDFADTACFGLVALSDLKAMELHRRLLIADGLLDKETPPLFSDELLGRIDDRIVDGFKVILGCDTGPGNGYSFTPEPENKVPTDQLYFTWNVLETLETLWQYVSSGSNVLPEDRISEEALEGRNITKWFVAKRADKLAHLTARFLSPLDSRKLYLGERVVDFGSEAAPDKNLYYNLYALMGLLLTDSDEIDELIKGMQLVLGLVDTSQKHLKKADYGEFDLAGSIEDEYEIGKKWSERAWAPQLLKAWNLIRTSFASQDWTQIEGLRDGDEAALVSGIATNSCRSLKHQQLEFDALWDRDKYAIYYTERVIEAMCRQYQVLGESKGLVPDYAAALGARTVSTSPPKLSTSTPASTHVSIHIDNEFITRAVLEQVRDVVAAQTAEAVESALAATSERALHFQQELERLVDKRVSETVALTLQVVFREVADKLRSNPDDTRALMVVDGITEAVSFGLRRATEQSRIDGTDEAAGRIVSQFADAHGAIWAASVAHAVIEGDPDAEDHGLVERRRRDFAKRLDQGARYLGGQIEGRGRAVNFIQSLERALEKGSLVVAERHGPADTASLAPRKKDSTDGQ